jgi:hypothetical protein
MNKKKMAVPEVVTAQPKGSLFKKTVRIIAKATQILIAAPLYLPPKFLKAVKYVALLMGLVKATTEKQADDE